MIVQLLLLAPSRSFFVGQTRTTKVIKSNLNPQWDEVSHYMLILRYPLCLTLMQSFQWLLVTAPEHGDAVSIEVFDKETLGPNK